MKNICVRTLVNSDIECEINKIGFDKSYLEPACEKYVYKNIKIYDLSSAQANIIKQTALTVGAECATHRDVITGQAKISNVILTGSVSQIKKIADKLETQPFSLSVLSETLKKEIVPKKRKTKLAGILNITPDSFSDGGLYLEPANALKRIEELINDGADIIDIGAESTRPYAETVDSAEQIKRLKPIIKELNKINVPVSIDTRNSEVADFALNNGAKIINDVSGFDYDPKMPDVIAKYDATVVIQHSKGNPQSMQNAPYYEDVIEEVYFSLLNKIEFAKEKGICNVIIDPGIGFGKNNEHNFEILNKIEEFYSLKCPVMVGLSRKSLLGIKENNNDLKDALTIALSYPLIQKGVDYLRVHNVKLHKQLLNLTI